MERSTIVRVQWTGFVAAVVVAVLGLVRALTTNGVPCLDSVASTDGSTSFGPDGCNGHPYVVEGLVYLGLGVAAACLVLLVGAVALRQLPNPLSRPDL